MSALAEVVLRPVSADCSAAARQLQLLAACLRGSPQRDALAEAAAAVLAASDLCLTHDVSSAPAQRHTGHLVVCYRVGPMLVCLEDVWLRYIRKIT